MSIPLYSQDLIEELDALYPEVIYDPKVDRDEFLLRSGERRLVLGLRLRMDRQLKEPHDDVYGQDAEAGQD